MLVKLSLLPSPSLPSLPSLSSLPPSALSLSRARALSLSLALSLPPSLSLALGKRQVADGGDNIATMASEDRPCGQYSVQVRMWQAVTRVFAV